MDPVTVEIIRAMFIAAAERMRISMIKTAYNMVISESLDFGIAIFDRDVQMIAQGDVAPLFQGHLGFPIVETIRLRGLNAVLPGDVFIHNDIYAGNGNHLNDVAMFTPVFWEGRLEGWVAIKAHWMDIGGAVPSSILTNSTDFRQEGLRFQGLKLCSRGELNEEVLRLLQSNIRVESNTLRDMQAMMAVCRIGEAYFKEIVGKYGSTTVATATQIFMAQSEKRARAELMKIPSGAYHAVGYFDNDGIDLERPIRIEVLVTVENGAITFDCTGSSPQVKGPFNCGAAITESACRLILKTLAAPNEPVDEGSFRPLKVIVPRGSVLAAQEPAPAARYYVPVNMLIELGLRALSAATPDRIPAGAFGDQMPAFLIGQASASGRGFIQGEVHCGGMGGRPTRDGESALSIIIGSTAQNNPVEITEARNPHMRILSYGLRQDSGGAGKFRGGLGTVRVYQCDVPVAGIFTMEREVTPPMGLSGGRDGAVNKIAVTDATGDVREVRKATLYPIGAHEIITFCSGGGGGFGDPSERDPAAIAEDLAEGYISPQAARDVYRLEVNR